MTRFVHPAAEDITLAGVLGALSDPMRLRIFKKLLENATDRCRARQRRPVQKWLSPRCHITSACCVMRG